MKGFMSEFKKFIMRGNVIDLAVGVIIGAAFQAIVNSLVNDIVMPVISLATKGVDFTNKLIVLGDLPEGVEKATLTLAQAQELGVAVIAYGNFINAILNFVIMAFVIFCLVKAINKISEKATKKEAEEAPAAPTTKACPYCKSEIAIDATRCPNCTSEL